MSTDTIALAFDAQQLHERLQAMSDAELDALDFGVIGFDTEGAVRRYNRYEASAAMFDVQHTLGQHVFVEVAPCLNNFMVAGRFDEAFADARALDETLPYVLTFRMRPTRVMLRLLAPAGAGMPYVLVQRTRKEAE